MRLAGHIENISCYLAACDLLVITSEREGMSLSMLEALQAGVPVLWAPVSGATELLPDKALIQSLNPEHLAAQLLQTLSHRRIDAITSGSLSARAKPDELTTTGAQNTRHLPATRLKTIPQ